MNLLNAAQMTIRLYRICEKAFKIVRAYIPNLAKLECGQFASARHALDLLGAAVEDFREIVNVQHTLFAPHATLLFTKRKFGWKKGVGFCEWVRENGNGMQ
jgi:hypothetical protein